MRKFFGTLLCLLMGTSAWAQQRVLSGHVTNADNQNLANVRITIADTDLFTISDAQGNFILRGLPAGNLQLSAMLSGYQDYRQKLNGKERQIIHITLHTPSHQLNEVNVKGRQSELRQREESLNVTLVNSDFIQRHLGGSLMKTLERLPGIKTIGIGSGQSKPLIRGLGFNRVVVTDKGIKHEGQQWGADHGLELDQFAAGEVELIKGAASFMYGSDAIGGAIDVKPAAVPATGSLGGSVDLIGKSNNSLYGTSVNLFGRNQHWFFDSRFSYQDYADYRVPADSLFVYDFPVGLYKNRLRNTAGRESGIHFNTGYISDHFRSVFYLSNVYSKSGFFANAHGLEPRRVNTELHDASDRDILMPSQEVNHFKIINRTVWQIPHQRWELDLGYQRNFRQEFSDYVSHGFMYPSYPETMAALIPSTLEREFDKQVYSINLRNQVGLERHTLTLGVNGEHQNNTISGWTFLVPAFKQTTAGAFAYDKFSVSERLILHGALRYDYGHIRTSGYTDWFPSEVTEAGVTRSEYAVRAEELDRSFHSFVWSAGINYNHEAFNLKANIGKSFRMPIAKELAANGVNYHYFSYEKGEATLSPEQSYQADLSAGWNAGKWSLQLSPFFNYFPNYIYLNPTPYHDFYYGAGNQIFQYTQSRVVRYGGELQVKYNFWKNLSSEILAEYLYSEQLSGDKKGYTLPFSPPASVLLNLSWSPELPGLSGSYLSLDYRITARQNNIVPPEKESPGYRVINVQAGTRLKLYKQTLILSLQAQNLLNTRYLNHTSFYRLIALPEAGRNIVLSLKVPFSLLHTKN